MVFEKVGLFLRQGIYEIFDYDHYCFKILFFFPLTWRTVLKLLTKIIGPASYDLCSLSWFAGIRTMRCGDVFDQPFETAFFSKHILQEARQCLILSTSQERYSAGKLRLSPCSRRCGRLKGLHSMRWKMAVQSSGDWRIHICKQILLGVAEDWQTLRRLQGKTGCRNQSDAYEELQGRSNEFTVFLIR